DDAERRPGDAGEAGLQVIVGKRLRAAGEALERGGADHAAHLVEHRRLGGDEFSRKPARNGDVGERLHALAGGKVDALLLLLRRGRGRGWAAVAGDDAVEPVSVALRQEQ